MITPQRPAADGPVNVFAVASIAAALLGLLLIYLVFLFPFVGLPFCLTGVAFGIAGLHQARRYRGAAIAAIGLALGAVGTAFLVLAPILATSSGS